MKYLMEILGFPYGFDIDSDYSLDVIYIMIEDAAKLGKTQIKFEHGPSDYDEISEAQANQLRIEGYEVNWTDSYYVVSWEHKLKG